MRVKLFRNFYPNEYKKSTYVIDFQKYYDMGYRGILFDVDNTLVHHGAPVDDRVKELFMKLKEIGFKTCLISNNKEPRVKPFADELGTKYIYSAHKPSRKSYRKAFDLLETDKEQTMFVGDQVFTDVYGANRVKMYTILVRPLHPKEEIQIVIKRKLEKIVLFFYREEKREIRRQKRLEKKQRREQVKEMKEIKRGNKKEQKKLENV